MHKIRGLGRGNRKSYVLLALIHPHPQSQTMLEKVILCPFHPSASTSATTFASAPLSGTVSLGPEV